MPYFQAAAKRPFTAPTEVARLAKILTDPLVLVPNEQGPLYLVDV